MRVPPTLVRAVARGKPLVPARVWPVLNTLASARGTAPLVADPEPTTTLVGCAHPDDELGCAGTVALLAASGAGVSVAYATDGGATRGAPYPAEVTGARRAAEAAEACRALGVPAPAFWGLPDGGLSTDDGTLVRRVEQAVAETAARRVLVPWFLDGHRDHEAVSRAVALADLPPDVQVWGFEWWTPLPANRVVDVTGVWPLKQRAAQCHRTAALAFDVTAGLSLSRFRSLSGLHGQGYAEAFLALPHADYRSAALGGGRG